MTASAGPALRRLHGEFGDRIAFVTLYVREAHPGDRYPQPETFDRKVAHAREYKARDDLAWPVAVDEVEGTLHRKLDAKPNAAYIVDREGKVAFRILWSNDRESVLRQALEAAARGEGPLGERTARMLPMNRGRAFMDEVLERAGPTARRDALREAPPMYAMARAAGRVRRLAASRR